MICFHYKAAIFDFDGTLFDSMPFWSTFTADYLRRYGIVQPYRRSGELYRKMLGEFADDVQNDCFPDFEPGRVRKEWESLIMDKYRDELQFKPGAEEYLHALKAQGVKCAIATLTDRWYILSAVKRIGWESLFDCILTVGDVGAYKNEPVIYERCAETLGVPPEECCVFEDSPIALGTASKAGFGCAGVIDRENCAEALLTITPRCFRTYSELLEGKLRL